MGFIAEDCKGRARVISKAKVAVLEHPDVASATTGRYLYCPEEVDYEAKTTESSDGRTYLRLLDGGWVPTKSRKDITKTVLEACRGFPALEPVAEAAEPSSRKAAARPKLASIAKWGGTKRAPQDESGKPARSFVRAPPPPLVRPPPLKRQKSEALALFQQLESELPVGSSLRRTLFAKGARVLAETIPPEDIAFFLRSMQFELAEVPISKRHARWVPGFGGDEQDEEEQVVPPDVVRLCEEMRTKRPVRAGNNLDRENLEWFVQELLSLQGGIPHLAEAWKMLKVIKITTTRNNAALSFLRMVSFWLEKKRHALGANFIDEAALLIADLVRVHGMGVQPCGQALVEYLKVFHAEKFGLQEGGQKDEDPQAYRLVSTLLAHWFPAPKKSHGWGWADENWDWAQWLQLADGILDQVTTAQQTSSAFCFKILARALFLIQEESGQQLCHLSNMDTERLAKLRIRLSRFLDVSDEELRRDYGKLGLWTSNRPGRR